MSLSRRLYRLITAFVALIARAIFPLTIRGRERLSERYGNWHISGKFDFWFHGASVGEMQGLLPLIAAVKKINSANRVLVTSTSPTGIAAAKHIADEIKILPFDLPHYFTRALQGVVVDRFVFGETELWPELLHFLQAKGVRSYLVNARISDHTIAFYKMIKQLIAPALSTLTATAVQTELECQRFIMLGVAREKIKLCGSAKYDRTPSLQSSAEIQKFRDEFFVDKRPVLTLGSIRPGEEDLWFSVIADALRAGNFFGVIVAPRHQEYFDYFARKLEKSEIPFRKRTELKLRMAKEKADTSVPSASVILLDTIGELEQTYAFSNAAFIGATLVDIGGHNPLEPAMYGVMPIVGPYVQNVREVVEQLEINNAVWKISTREQTVEVLAELIKCSDRLAANGQRAKKIWQQNCGATQRILNLLGVSTDVS